jgi:hypothetical protein
MQPYRRERLGHSSAMDGYQFIASLVQSIASLAWPAALVLIVLIFREKFRELLPLLRVKHKDIEVSFRLAQAEKEAAALPEVPPAPDGAKPTPEERSRFDQLVEASPRAAIAETRAEIEQAIHSLARRHGVTASKGASNMMIRLLRSTNVIDAPRLLFWMICVRSEIKRYTEIRPSSLQKRTPCVPVNSPMMLSGDCLRSDLLKPAGSLVHH